MVQESSAWLPEFYGLSNEQRTKELIRAIGQRESGYVFNDDGWVEKAVVAIASKIPRKFTVVDLGENLNADKLRAALGIPEGPYGFIDWEAYRRSETFLVARRFDRFIEARQQWSDEIEIAQAIVLGTDYARGSLWTFEGNTERPVINRAMSVPMLDDFIVEHWEPFHNIGKINE